MTTHEPTRSRGRSAPPGGHRGLVALLRALQRTRGRLALVAVVGAALALAAMATNLGGAGRSALAGLLVEGAFLFAVPVTTLVFATASLGDLRDDETLVYVFFRPIPRTRLALAATVASLEIAVPANVVVLAAIVLVGGEPGLLLGSVAAGAAGTVAYGAVFVALGLRTSRSLLWGLAYVLLYEAFLARLSERFAALSIRRYATSVLSGTSDVANDFHEVGIAAALAGLAAFTLAGIAACTRWLQARDVP